MRGPAVVLMTLAMGAAPAAAHGPCGCLVPASGSPGAAVRAEYPSYKVVFNPDRSDLAIGPPRLWRAHQGPPPATVVRRPWRHGRRYASPTFRIPEATPPGRYLVALYDGGEGGAHYSWATFRVRPARAAPAAEPRTSRPEAGSGTSGAWLAGAAGLLLGLGVGLVARR